MGAPDNKQIARGGGVLLLFAILGAASVAMVEINTRDLIAENERQAILSRLETVIGDLDFDNNLYTDTVDITDLYSMGTGQTLPAYRARLQGEPVAIVLTPVAPDGYNGAIRLLVGISHGGTVTGVRVVAHQETPGLGDGIDRRRSNWVESFNGLSLENPGPKGWAVQRDGGQFDQFTGATITPRAVVSAVRRTLEYFEKNRDLLMAPEQ